MIGKREGECRDFPFLAMGHAFGDHEYQQAVKNACQNVEDQSDQQGAVDCRIDGALPTQRA